MAHAYKFHMVRPVPRCDSYACLQDHLFVTRLCTSPAVKNCQYHHLHSASDLQIRLLCSDVHL